MTYQTALLLTRTASDFLWNISSIFFANFFTSWRPSISSIATSFSYSLYFWGKKWKKKKKELRKKLFKEPVEILTTNDWFLLRCCWYSLLIWWLFVDRMLLGRKTLTFRRNNGVSIRILLRKYNRNIYAMHSRNIFSFTTVKLPLQTTKHQNIEEKNLCIPFKSILNQWYTYVFAI